MPQSVVIRGRVEPPTEALVSAESSAPDDRSASGQSDLSGVFVVRGAPLGKLKISAHARDGRAGEVSISAEVDQTGVVVPLHPRASVTGRVVDDRGAAVAYAAVWANEHRATAGPDG